MDGPPLRCHDPSMASLCDMQVALMASVQSVLAVQSEHTKSLVDLIIKVDKVIDLIKKKESAETSKVLSKESLNVICFLKKKWQREQENEIWVAEQTCKSARRKKKESSCHDVCTLVFLTAAR